MDRLDLLSFSQLANKKGAQITLYQEVPILLILLTRDPMVTGLKKELRNLQKFKALLNTKESFLLRNLHPSLF